METHIGARIEAEAGIGERRNGRVGRRSGDGVNRSIPVVVDLSGTITGDSAGNAVIDLGSPRPGFVWEVRSIFICGPTPQASLTGAAAVYVGGAVGWIQGQTPNFNPSNARDSSASIPNTGAWGEKQIRVASEQHLVVVFSGLPATQTVFATAQAEVYATSTYYSAPRGED